MPAKYEGDTCKVAGCDQPRMELNSGKLSTMCETHQREHWRQGKRKAPAKPAPQRKVAAVKVAAAPVGLRPVPAPASGAGCEGCIHREVLERIMARDPRVRDLVAAMERVRDLEREMFDQEAQPQHIPTGAPVEANALIIDGLDNTVSSAVLTVLDRAATDGAADLRQRMQAARMEGALLLRIHRMAGDEAHEA